MAFEFKKLSDVEALNEVPEGANALVEINGAIKRVPGSGLGGAAGIKTIIIRSSDYENAISGGSSERAEDGVTYSCINMTFEEAYETLEAGEPLSAIAMVFVNAPIISSSISIIFAGIMFGVPCIGVELAPVLGGNLISQTLYWTADGLSTEQPVQPK